MPGNGAYPYLAPGLQRVAVETQTATPKEKDREEGRRGAVLGPGSKNNPAYQQLLAAARKQVAMMDRVDEKRGFAHHDLLMSVRDSMAAISAGMQLKSWNEVAEGFVMLQQLELTIRDALPGASR